ncbi:hypothetical protein LTS18_012674, partial [Coniosporium uncinatum]
MESVKKAVDEIANGLTKAAGDEAKPANQNTQKAAKKEKKKPAAAADELDPKPEFIKKRDDLFNTLWERQQEELAKKPREDITVTGADGKEIKQKSGESWKSWESSPAKIAADISPSLLKRTVVAEVDGVLWDLKRPLEKSCKLRLLDFSDPEAKKVFWHSSAHILGEACERRFGCSLCIGPPVEDGFYYEMSLPDGAPVQTEDWAPIERIVGKITKEKQDFQRLEVSKDDLLRMFDYNRFKQHIIKDKIPDGTRTTVYKN